MKLFTKQTEQVDSLVSAHTIQNVANRPHGPLAEDKLSYGDGALPEATTFRDIALTTSWLIPIPFGVLGAGYVFDDAMNADGYFSFGSFALVIFVASALGVLLSQLATSSMDTKELKNQKAIFARNVKWVSKNLKVKEDVAAHLLRCGSDLKHRYLHLGEDKATLYRGVNGNTAGLVLLREAELNQDFHDMLKIKRAKK